ncbi:SDR family NAD(P)-dependent oxidoreductase [Robertkochia aurantiaca]|uniref:SDR family NAD(P)-dependent oxidoreductase n=1 Tax=Robertkochia aurantiaca TaxID=2873700 RepID=UPI001CCF9B13|nr:SDR family oxidoreductase [Robertkochia sp. 3YJGBD-33]
MKKIIITGTSRGIGFELVKHLASQGHQILALSRNDKPVKELNLPEVTAFSFDLSSQSDLEELDGFLTNQWGAADILINNAGSFLHKSFEQITSEEFRKVFEVNVIGVAAITQRILPFMQEGAHVINISSMGGVQGSVKFPGLSAYSSSKGALITLTELLAEEYKESGIAFNVLALGAVQTEMLEAAFPGMKAPVSAAEMAEYIADFALKGNRYYNGKLLQVSSTTP